jgi:glyoxylase-like metal-dependent hydrolase (beta-lactamase superfamily II)/8-oxo-dGTP pyrophosphatase MutT (NUDIX family)
MIRPHLQLHDYIKPVAPRQAATVLLLRDVQGDLEVLMTQRSHTASFAPSMYVFPGGVVDAGETFEQAAVRECMEELNIALDITTLHWQSHWITDRDMPKRFDVRFYVAPMPHGQTPVADEQEQFHPTWIKPKEALAMHQAKQFPMIFPTIRTLEWFAKFETSAQVFAACQSQTPHWSSCPRSGHMAGKPHYFMEHDAPYGELELVCPDGIKRHALDWTHDAPVPLLKHVRRLTCGNPGMMTGPGTNSYIIGTVDTGFIVIDPGPYGTYDLSTPDADKAHVQRLADSCKNADGVVDIRAIVCTHSHPDHSPAAAPLQALCSKTSQPVPKIYGMKNLPTARPHSDFVPDVQTKDADVLTLQGGDLTITLRAIHTPGHAANHVCWALEEDGLLISGDHVLNGSTTVIDPPDGNMTDYLESLDKLTKACEQYDIQYILPAHGYVLGFAKDAIAKLKAHRLGREAKVKKALEAMPRAALDELVALAYDDVSPKLWPIAMRSLAAHVERIKALDQTVVSPTTRAVLV